jgi:hypothetical protein
MSQDRLDLVPLGKAGSQIVHDDALAARRGESNGKRRRSRKASQEDSISGASRQTFQAQFPMVRPAGNSVAARAVSSVMQAM